MSDDTAEPYRPTIHTQADLEHVWRYLMEPLGFSGASIWLMHVEPDRRPVPQLIEIAGADEIPTRGESAGFVAMLHTMESDSPGGSFAFLRSRPGGYTADAADLAWADYLYGVLRDAGLAVEVVHLATDVDVIPLPMDTLTQRSA